MNFYCTNCNERLNKENYLKSAARCNKDFTEECYISCKKCGKIMIANYEKILYDLNPTPTVNNETTQCLIDEAIELFEENNHIIKNYSFNLPRNEIEELTEKLEKANGCKLTIINTLKEAIDKIKNL